MRLILHIGMHKTASTTIQKRLKANNQQLEEFGYKYISKNRKALLKAVQEKNFKPWRELILEAKTQGMRPIVSHEALSHVLCRPQSSKKPDCIGDWLLKKLSQTGVNVTVIGFVRDQPSYLNSHYTQHVKRFATDQSLEAYASKAMQATIGKSSCDPEQLFGWLQKHPSVHAVFFPYGRSITPPPALENGPKEPFTQLIHCLGIPETVQLKPVAKLNTQPGDLAIRTALKLSQELKREGIQLGKKAKQARTLICREAERRNWMEHRFKAWIQSSISASEPTSQQPTTALPSESGDAPGIRFSPQVLQQLAAFPARQKREKFIRPSSRSAADWSRNRSASSPGFGS